MRVLVTGADGFVGEHLVRALLGRGHEVVGGIREARPLTRTLSTAETGSTTWITFELVDRAAVHRLIDRAQPDAVLHLAGLSSVRDSWQRPEEVFDVNAVGVMHLLLAVRELPPSAVRRPVLLVGSSEVYGGAGTAESPLTEDSPLRPRNPYGASKAAQEMVGWALGRTDAIRLVQTRSFSHTGPGQRPPFVFADWGLQLLRIRQGLQAPIIRVGNLRIVRDITDVRDVADAYVRLLETPDAEGVFNVCSGRECSLERLLALLQQAVGAQAQVKEEGARLRPAEVMSLVGSPARLHQATGWEARRPIEDTLKDLVASLEAEDLQSFAIA